MSDEIKTILAQALRDADGKTIHVRMEMPYEWGVTLSGEMDGKDIAVPGDLAFAEYADRYRAGHPGKKCNIIDFFLTAGGDFEEKPRYDAAFQREQDAL